MQVEHLSLPKKQLEEELTALKAAVKANHKIEKTLIVKDLLKVYGFLNRYKKPYLIDVPLSFKQAGLNQDGDPKLAIARADAKTIHGTKYRNGSLLLQPNRRTRNVSKAKGDMTLTPGTFDFPVETFNPPQNWTRIKRENIEAPVPIIPAKLLHIVKTKLTNYHILWEIEKWEPDPPKDPMLLRQLTPNLYGVLAAWDLTPLERAVIRGRL